jgi:hypothetical protein
VTGLVRSGGGADTAGSDAGGTVAAWGLDRGRSGGGGGGLLLQVALHQRHRCDKLYATVVAEEWWWWWLDVRRCMWGGACGTLAMWGGASGEVRISQNQEYLFTSVYI